MMPPLTDYILVTIRKESPVLTAVLKSDCRTMKANGMDWADENRVFRVLAELEAAGLVERTRTDGNEWKRPESKSEPVKVKQQELFA